jgi:hypothetical protein
MTPVTSGNKTVLTGDLLHRLTVLALRWDASTGISEAHQDAARGGGTRGKVLSVPAGRNDGYTGGEEGAGSSRACKLELRCVLATQSYAQGRSEYKFGAVDCVLLRSLNLRLGFFRKVVDLAFEMCHKVVNT